MDTLAERLKYARKSRGFTQDSLGDAIGVSRGVIFNLEKNKAEPQTIVINAICQVLKINKPWLVSGIGDMETPVESTRSAKILMELYDTVKDLTESEQLYLLDTIKSVKERFGNRLVP